MYMWIKLLSMVQRVHAFTIMIDITKMPNEGITFNNMFIDCELEPVSLFMQLTLDITKMFRFLPIW